MVASRIRVMSASYSARFWFSAFCIALMPTSIGYQDLTALLALNALAAPAASVAPVSMIVAPLTALASAVMYFDVTFKDFTSVPDEIAHQDIGDVVVELEGRGSHLLYHSLL